MFEELNPVAQVARMLPIQHRHQLAVVRVLQLHHWHFRINVNTLHATDVSATRCIRCTVPLNTNSFDFDLNGIAAHQQLDLSCFYR